MSCVPDTFNLHNPIAVERDEQDANYNRTPCNAEMFGLFHVKNTPNRIKFLCADSSWKSLCKVLPLSLSRVIFLTDRSVENDLKCFRSFILD